MQGTTVQNGVEVWFDTMRQDLGFNAEKTLEWIGRAFSRGMDVYVCNHAGYTKATRKAADKWEAAGKPLFHAKDNRLYMRRGRQSVIIDLCILKAF